MNIVQEMLQRFDVRAHITCVNIKWFAFSSESYFFLNNKNNILGSNTVLGKYCLKTADHINISLLARCHEEYVQIYSEEQRLLAIKKFLEFVLPYTNSYTVDVVLDEFQGLPWLLTEDNTYLGLNTWLTAYKVSPNRFVAHIPRGSE